MKIGPDLQQYQVIRPPRDQNTPNPQDVKPFDMKAHDFSKMSAVEAFNLMDDLYAAGLMSSDDCTTLYLMIFDELGAVLRGESLDITTTSDLKTRMQNAAPWYRVRGDDLFDRLFQTVQKIERLSDSK